MDPCWEAIRVSLLAKVEVMEAEPSFAAIGALLPSLCGCVRAPDAINVARRDKRIREDLCRALAEMWHGSKDLRETIDALVMLCLWRKLTMVFSKQLVYWTGEGKELAAEMVKVFLGELRDRALLRASVVSETLWRRTEQRVIYIRRRQRRIARERHKPEELPLWVLEPPRPGREVQRFELTEAIIALGREAELDLDLLIDVFRSDHDYDAVAARRGMTKERAMGETKRLLLRLRMHVEAKSKPTPVFGSEKSSSIGSVLIGGEANDNALEAGGSDDDDDGDGNNSGTGGL